MEINATALPRFMACNGSQMLGGQLPPSTDDPTARNEGIAAHWVITEAYNRACDPAEFLNQRAPNGVKITQSILKSVAEFSRYISECGAPLQGFEVDCSFANVPARCDFYSWDGMTLTVADFKHGFRIVEPVGNWTLIAYAIGLSIMSGSWPKRVVLEIHQPRVAHPDGPVRRWEITGDYLKSLHDHLVARLAQPDNQVRTGDHCARCPSQTICPAMRSASYNAVDVSMTAHAENITDDLIAQELTVVQDAAKRLKARQKQLEDLAAYRLKNGAIIEGYGLERSYSNMTWKEGLEPDFLSTMLGVECARISAITPTQAVSAGANETVVKQLSDRIETGLKLSRISAQKAAEKMFGKRG